MRDIANFHAALADETRLRLLCLMKEEVCVCHLQAVLRTNQPKISRHLAYLKRRGLVDARHDGKWTHYKIKAQPAGLKEILLKSLAHASNQARARQDARRLKKLRR